MIRKAIIAASAVAVAAFCACSDMASLGSLAGVTKSASSSLTSTEITAGLKEALNLGVQAGVKYLGASGGYYNDLAYRIGLPEEAAVITKNISKLPGGQTLVTKVVRNINEAASDAASKATPIFASAITSMTISDARNILMGNKTAATTYFKTKTKPGLKTLFGGYIDTSINKKIIGDVSAQSSWNTLTSNWNSVATTMVGKAAGLTAVNTNLSDYLTDKAVDGLYKKVGEKESAIRSDATQRTSALLKKVFGH
jgi:hypothetical protein